MGILLSKGLSTQTTDELGNIITSEGKSIFIKNTNIELPEVYVRVSFDCGYDGKTMSIKFQTYLNHDAYLQKKNIIIDINQISFDFTILDTEIQSLNVALSYLRDRFIELGYNAEIL